MSKHQIHVFISHSWSYSGHYEKLSNWVFGENWSVGQASLDFRDFSVPRSDPIHNANSEQALRKAIYDKIGRSHAVVIPTGMYVEHSTWIKKEIEGAKFYGKPILGVNPWGQQRTSTVVQKHAQDVVGWNKQSVVDKLWEYFRD